MSKYKKMKQLIADMRLPEYRYKRMSGMFFDFKRCGNLVP